jgi:hypothetical protein
VNDNRRVDIPTKLQLRPGQSVFLGDVPADVTLGLALVWVAYPKAGKLGTDLNRDRLWQLVQDEGIRPVRQIAIDEVWSALRFRSA